jgi:hypothetical protein
MGVVTSIFMVFLAHRAVRWKFKTAFRHFPQTSDSRLRVMERFLYLLRELIRYFVTNPFHFRYMEQYYNSPYGISLHRDRLLGKSDIHGILMDIFEQGIEQQLLKEFPKAVLFSLAFGPLISLMRDHNVGFIVLDDPLIEQFTETCRDAIKR